MRRAHGEDHLEYIPDEYNGVRQFLLDRKIACPYWDKMKSHMPTRKGSDSFLKDFTAELCNPFILTILKFEREKGSQMLNLNEVSQQFTPIGTIFRIVYVKDGFLKLQTCDGKKIKPQKMNYFVQKYLHWTPFVESIWQQNHMWTWAFINTIIRISKACLPGWNEKSCDSWYKYGEPYPDVLPLTFEIPPTLPSLKFDSTSNPCQQLSNTSIYTNSHSLSLPVYTPSSCTSSCTFTSTCSSNSSNSTSNFFPLTASTSSPLTLHLNSQLSSPLPSMFPSTQFPSMAGSVYNPFAPSLHDLQWDLTSDFQTSSSTFGGNLFYDCKLDADHAYHNPCNYKKNNNLITLCDSLVKDYFPTNSGPCLCIQPKVCIPEHQAIMDQHHKEAVWSKQDDLLSWFPTTPPNSPSFTAL